MLQKSQSIKFLLAKECKCTSNSIKSYQTKPFPKAVNSGLQEVLTVLIDIHTTKL